MIVMGEAKRATANAITNHYRCISNNFPESDSQDLYRIEAKRKRKAKSVM